MNKTQYVENVAMGLHTLRSHKLRSFLTVLGVIIGVAVVIVIASLLTGMRQNIVTLVEEFGTDNIFAFHLTTGPRFGPLPRSEWMRKPLRVEDAQALKQESTAIADVAYQGWAMNMDTTLKYQGESYTRARLTGVSPNQAFVSAIAMKEGRFISESDDMRRGQVCVLGVSVVEGLFPHQETIVGRIIYIGGQRFSVVGLLEKKKGSFFGENDEDNLVYIPYQTLRKLSPRSDWIWMTIKAKPEMFAKAMDQTESILRRQRGVRFNEPNNFDLTTPDKLISQFDQMTASIGIIVIAISGVGLLVGGIGVMNIMLVSVTERTREIGVRKAVGAKRQDITFQFLFEAMTLTTVGGILGIIIATIVSYLVMFFFPSLPASIPLWAVITGFLVSMFIGLVFGVWPAVKASRLDPIESLRYE